MLRIRLRIVVADARAPRDGKFVDQVGHYDPLTDPPTVVLAEEKVRNWLGQGAQPSDTVARLLQVKGILEKAG